MALCYSYGYTMAVLWLYYGCTLAVLWLYSGYAMAMLWLYYGYTMATRMAVLWLYYGCTMAVLWLYYGYTMALLWLYFGYTLPYYGYTMAYLPCGYRNILTVWLHSLCACPELQGDPDGGAQLRGLLGDFQAAYATEHPRLHRAKLDLQRRRRDPEVRSAAEERRAVRAWRAAAGRRRVSTVD